MIFALRFGFLRLLTLGLRSRAAFSVTPGELILTSCWMPGIRDITKLSSSLGLSCTAGTSKKMCKDSLPWRQLSQKLTGCARYTSVAGPPLGKISSCAVGALHRESHLEVSLFLFLKTACLNPRKEFSKFSRFDKQIRLNILTFSTSSCKD